eukprot:3951350-Amphidinium_carterae.1
MMTPDSKKCTYALAGAYSRRFNTEKQVNAEHLASHAQCSFMPLGSKEVLHPLTQATQPYLVLSHIMRREMKVLAQHGSQRGVLRA